MSGNRYNGRPRALLLRKWLAAGTDANAFDGFTGSAVNAYVLAPAGAFETSTIADRDNAVNLHFGIPRKSGLKDDIQVLGMLNSIKTGFLDRRMIWAARRF